MPPGVTPAGNLLYPTPISQLTPGRPAMVHGVVVQVGPLQEANLKERAKAFREVLLRDPTGEVPLVLWGEETGHVQEADRAIIVEAWVREFKGHPQLSLGKRGYLVNLGPANGHGPLRSPPPSERGFIWGLVRRRLREKELKGTEGEA